MRLLLLSLFAAVALSSCHLVVHDVGYRPAPYVVHDVVHPVHVVHCHHSAPPHCRMQWERSGRRGAVSIPGKRPVPMRPFVAAAPTKKRY
jgi:hypothetical protein